MVTFFNLMAVVCVGVIANWFLLLTKNDIIVHYNKFSNLGVHHATFPNLKDTRAPSQNCKKKSLNYGILSNDIMPGSEKNTMH